MQEAQDGGRLGHPPIKEEDKELPPGAEYLSSRCVLFTYFQGDISAVVDEHFSRALSHAGSYTAPSSHKAAKGVCVCVCVCVCVRVQTSGLGSGVRAQGSGFGWVGCLCP